VILYEIVISTDLGSSSKYSSERKNPSLWGILCVKLEDWSGERFHKNSNWIWV